MRDGLTGWGAGEPGGEEGGKIPHYRSSQEYPNEDAAWSRAVDLVHGVSDAKMFVNVPYHVGELSEFIRQQIRDADCLVEPRVETWIEETARDHFRRNRGEKPAKRECRLLKTSLVAVGFNTEAPLGDVLDHLRKEDFRFDIALPVVYWAFRYVYQPIGECVYVLSDDLVIEGERPFHLKICNFGGRRSIEDTYVNPHRILRPEQQIIIGVPDVTEEDAESFFKQR